MQLVGYPYSPFVRKVILVLEHKGLAYDLNPIDPFNHKDEIVKLNPSGKVPVMVTDNFALSESDRIVTWLDEQFSDNRVIPVDRHLRERVIVTSEWADQACAGVLGGKLFFQRVIKPQVLDSKGDQAQINDALEQAGPTLLAGLEKNAPRHDFSVGELSLADFTLSSWLRTGMLAGLSLTSNSYPMLYAYLQRVYACAAWQATICSENNLPVIQYALDHCALNTDLLR